jgi:hypothetical protein
MVKTFPKSRVSVIDIYPLFEEALKKAISFSKNHNISLNSSDGKKLILGYCLKDIEKTYNETKSEYPKVLGLNTTQVNPKFKHFLETHFDKMMNYLPAPYCGKLSFSSPDLEYAAQKSLKEFKTKKRYSNYLKFLKLKQ